MLETHVCVDCLLGVHTGPGSSKLAAVPKVSALIVPTENQGAPKQRGSGNFGPKTQSQ